MHALWNQLERAARLREGEPVISCGSQRLSWRDALDLASRMARVLADLGATQGERIAFISPNSMTYMLMPFAADCTGAIFVPLNSRLAVSELVAQVEDFAPALIVAAEPFVSIARQVAGATGVPLLTIDGDDSAPGLNSMVANAAPLSPLDRPAETPVAIYYTGGTTGRAKGVILHGDRLVMNALQWAQGVNARDDENLLVVAPMFHMVAALNAIITAVLACNLTILDRFAPEPTLEAIARERVTNMGLVPAMIDMLLGVENLAGHDLSSLRTLTYGGSPISQKTLARALECLPHVRLYQVYGQTEGGPTISILPSEWHSTDPACAARLRSAGKALPLTDLRIVQPDGTECPRGKTGEITVRGPAISSGYWNQPEENATAFRNGWLHTGDAGYLDQGGFLYIVDRIKDMIVTGGENVYAAEVERVIIQHPAVQECAVVGVPSERWGEAVHAIIRLRANSQANETEIIDFCRARISAYKSPRSVSFPCDAFPLTGAGKVDKRALRASLVQSDAA